MEPELKPYNPYDQKVPIKTHIIEFIQTLVVFAAIGTAIYLFIAQPHKVSGSSMFPNFQNGDYIITNKVGYRFGQPQRGQVIVFKDPLNESEDFIKRIIGLPGEKVKVSDCHIFVNGQQLNETAYLNPSICTTGGRFLPDDQETVIPDDHFFVLGDNRPQSSDSREWGFITRGEIIGQAFFRYWPENEIGIVPTMSYKSRIQ